MFLGLWLFIAYFHFLGNQAVSSVPVAHLRTAGNDFPKPVITTHTHEHANAEEGLPFEDTDESYHIVFSTGCSEFQDWQSIGVYSSAETVGQRGIITRIASGCTEKQKVALSQALSHLPKRCRIHFAPDTEVKDHAGHFYKYANKPLGMMHWLTNANPKVRDAYDIVI
jgi:hypothetical protein